MIPEKSKLSVLIVLILSTLIHAQSITPKREMRAAWIATVTNIDWPVRGASPASQQASLTSILDDLKSARLNAVMFQIRPECDALYESKIEPWSYWLTGVQGQAPSPYYDPLQFAINEAHSRGMELHAWFNPYRAERSAGNYTTASNHVTKQHPDWVLALGNYRLLDPGLQTVRNYVVSVIMDVVRRYDVDGVHFDDYFYESSITTQDDKTFAAEPRGFTNKGDWRRDNVNLLVKQINDSIMSVKPWVKWGISPRGIYRPGYPAGITGSDNYTAIFTDPLKWLNTKSIDYINPQLYWIFGGGQDYGKLMPWWAQSAGNAGRHMYVGHANYRITESTWSSSEVPNQVRLNRKTTDCFGSVFYNTNTLLSNPKGFLDSLKNDLFRYQALVPNMAWKDQLPPNPARNLKFDRLPNTNIFALQWDMPLKASDGDSAARFVIYKLKQASVTQADLDDPANITNITGNTYTQLKPASVNGTVYFAVTAIDRNSNESPAGSVIAINPPAAPLLAIPSDNALNQKDTVYLRWKSVAGASYYDLLLGEDQEFKTGTLFTRPNLTDTVTVFTGLSGQQKYYWKVIASNPAGQSDYSKVNSFTTGFPTSVTLAEPPHATLDVTLSPSLKWKKELFASSYNLQLSTSMTVTSQSLVLDTAGIKDTLLNVKNLLSSKNYFWRVRPTNEFGTGAWSPFWAFRTASPSDVEQTTASVTEFNLMQNYPNPFNPSTRITYSLAKDGLVRLSVYNILGKEIAVLVDKYQPSGTYNVEFNISDAGLNLTSGIYFYTIKSGSYFNTRKMTIIK